MLSIFAALAAQVAAPEMPTWMAGCWESETGDRSTVECWSMPSEGGAVMRGESVSRAGGKVVEPVHGAAGPDAAAAIAGGEGGIEAWRQLVDRRELIAARRFGGRGSGAAALHGLGDAE